MRSIFQNKSLAYTIIFLLVANLAVLAYFAFFKEPSGKKMRPKGLLKEFVVKDLGFSEDQKKAFEQMNTQNSNNYGLLINEISSARDSLNKLVLVENLDDSLLFDRSLIVAEKQRAFVLEQFRQYKSIYSMCTPEQKIKFNQKFPLFLEKMRPPKKDSTKRH